MQEFVTHEECEDYRREYDEKLLDHSLKIVELQTTMKRLLATNNLILGAVISGMVTIIVILLTRGI